jgi:hypothetical protein
MKDTVNKKTLREAIKQGGTEIVVREGNAAVIHEPEIITLTGVITSPGEFLKKRTSVVDEARLKTHLTYSKESRWIKLVVDEENHFRTTIKGELHLNPYLAEYGINKKKTWTTKDLAQFLKMRKAHFADREQCLQMVANLTKFNAEINTKIQSEDDSKGNKLDSFATQLKTNLGLEFTLKMKVFKGQEEHAFKVEICVDARDKGVTMWLESEELNTIEIDKSDEIINAEVAKFKDYVCIEQ